MLNNEIAIQTIHTTSTLSFNEYGLLPEGIKSLCLKDAQRLLCFNNHRINLWKNLHVVMQEARDFGIAGDVLIDGSFVTDKALPSDIEVIVDVRNETKEKQGLAAAFYIVHHNRLKEEYEIDWYPNLPSENDFSLFFQYLGEKGAVDKNLSATHLKGIIKLIL